MPRKKKEMPPEEPEQELQEEVLMLSAAPPDISPAALRLQLLGLSKEILEHQSHLKWETHTKFVDVSISDIIQGARDLLDFIYETEE